MSNSYGPRTASRIFDLDAKSLQLLIARTGKAITDAEGIFIQDLQAAKLSQFANTQTFSGCVDLPSFKMDPANPNGVVIPPFRALIGSNLLYVQGTNNPNSPSNLDNYLYLSDSPAVGYGITIVYLEAWYQILDEVLGDTASFPGVTNQGFWPNYYPITWNPLTNPRYYFPYGNSLAHPNWIQLPQFLDDLNDPMAGYTSGRVQLQYAIRTQQINPISNVQPLTAYLKDFGMTHPNVGGQTATPAALSAPPPFTFNGLTDPGLYTSSSPKLRTIDNNSYAIPLAIIYQRNTGVWDPMVNPHGTRAVLSPSTVSGRPDGKLANIVYPNDVIDTRSSFLGGSLEDYKSTIAQAASRLWKGALRLKLAEPPATDPTAHQLGQTLLSQEYIGQPITTPFQVNSPIPCISNNSVPQVSWTSDSYGDTLTYMVTPANKNIVTGGSVNKTQWVAGDTVTITHPNSSVIFENATLFTFNGLAQIFKVPPAYISVSGLGSNALNLTFFNIGVDSRFNLSNPIWITTTIKKPKSTDHFRFIPTKVHPPIFMDPATINGSYVPCGSISDFSMGYEDFSIASTYPSRSYKRNFDSNIFGTIRKVKVSTQNFTSKNASDVSGIIGQLQVNFQAVSQTTANQTVLLTWNVTNATRATLTNTTTGVPIGNVPLSGSMSVRITQTCVYTLTAYNDTLGTSQATPITVNPPTDLVGGSAASGDVLSKVYAAPGGSLNPENTLIDYSTVTIPSNPGFGSLLDNVMLGCVRATLYRQDETGAFSATELQIRHQYFTGNTGNNGLGSSEIGFFGQFESNATDYVELELLVTQMKTFHYNPTVQGVTAVTETVAPSLNNYLFFSTSSNTGEAYTFFSNPDYPNAAMDLVVPAPTETWGTNQIGGIFEGVFGFNGQGYVFIKQSGDLFYRTTPCTYSGLGTPLLRISLTQVALTDIEDVLVLAQSTASLSPTSTVLFNYDYVPYQGEGDSSDSYTLTYLDPEVLVTTFGTGTRSIPGLTSTASTNPELPVVSVLPSITGWDDADLSSAKFTVGGVFSGLENPAYTNTEFLSTKALSTVSGNLRNLLDLSGSSYPALSPRGATQRGFSTNTVAFAYVIDPPQIISSPHTLNSSTQSDLIYWVDPLLGDDTNSGMTRETPKKSLQILMDSLPDIIRHKITIYVNGNIVLSTQTLPELNITQATPYGQPDEESIYSLLKTSFNTQGDGVVIVSQDPMLTAVANIQTIASTPIDSTPVYGWLHLGGRLEVDGFIFNVDQVSSVPSQVSFAAYPGSRVAFNNCGFIGGGTQLIGYGSNIVLGNSSFTDTLTHNIIVSNGATLDLTDGMTFNKGTATGFTVVAEKNSTVNILTDAIACANYPSAAGVEFLIKAYSTIDTHRHPNFTFPVGKLQLADFSTQVLPNSNAKPFVVVGNLAPSDTYNQVFIAP